MKKAPFPAKEKVLFNTTKKHLNTLISLCKSKIPYSYLALSIIGDCITAFLLTIILYTAIGALL